MPYKFLEVSTEILSKTELDWNQQVSDLQSEVLVPKYERVLDWAKKHLDGGSDDNNHLYAITRTENPEVACAMLVLSHARPNSNSPWLKVLEINVEPKLDVSNNVDIAELASIASRAVVETLGLTFQEFPSQELKIYATTPLTKEFLEGVTSSIATQVNARISSHGNWVIIKKL